MVEIKISSSKDDDILTQDDAINLANLKLYTNVNVKNLKTNRKNVLFIICNVLIFLILIICFMISRIILITAQNEENTIRIYRTSEEVHRKIKDLEVRINNIMSRLKYNNQNIISTYPWRIRSIDYSKSFIREPANLSKIKNDRDSNTALVIFDVNNSTVPSAFVQSLTTMDRQNHVIEKNSSIFDIINPSIRSENNLITEPKMKDLLREKRAILKIEAQNHTMTKDVQSGNDTMDTSRESRARKLQRDEGRGKKRRLNRRRPKRSRRRLDPAVVTFVGAIPEQEFKNTGPWIKSSRSNGAYDFTKFYLAEENYSIEVTISGLYMISVQIFYFGKPINHSYWVLLNSEGSSMKQKLITCAIASVSTEGGSCYTSITTYLQKGDRLSIQQQERNRLVKLREGYSQVQLVLLANDKHRRGPRANIFYNEHLCSTRIHIFI
ncbi:uncharacterized protein LOC126856731 isoform X2 [Cataglyphis hispanica]|uniref:uncharacterized protein LOC126856731 isoform X2 n=1 Tax=Cataglyphis hispanica TaxID=1086592 RepID=UPI00217F5C14|nr:uncharacterized protein LOC126856731 isoform X2 [Cataglyphis hispanica]